MPKHAPVSREQWKEWNQVWPISWRKPELTAVTAATAAAQGVTAAEEHLMHLWMDRAYRLAEAHACSGTVCNAAVIVDPIRGQLCDYIALRRILEHWFTLSGHIASCSIAPRCIASCWHVLASAVCCLLPINHHLRAFSVLSTWLHVLVLPRHQFGCMRYQCTPQSHGCYRLVG